MSSAIKNLPNNNRFYVLVFSFLTSIFVVCLLRIKNVDSHLYYIQLEQVFGFLAIASLYMTLIISPVQKVIGTPEWMKNVIFSRRAFGVSVVYFALLHAAVALGAELGGIGGLALLPGTFIWPLIYGASALAILCFMACTSLDKVIVLLGYRRWKWLQRLVYLCGILIIAHVWIIGVHLGSGVIRDTFLVTMVVLFGLESWRIVSFLAERYHWRKTVKHFSFLAVWFAGVLLLGWISFSRPAEAHMMLKDTVSGKGAILHINPDDDPVAGERTSFLFDVQDTSPFEEQSTARLTIVDEQHHEINVLARVKGNTVVADYTFPRQGLYTLTLDIQQGDKQTHRFTESQRVSRGVINFATVRNTPLWAGVGMMCTVITAIAVAIIAFDRRKIINIYSKL